MFAIQDQVISTKNYRKYILKEKNVSDLCRLCNQSSETIQHISSSCTALSNTEYLNRHDLSAKILHQYLARKYCNIKDSTPYYKYQPKAVIETDTIQLYWNRPIITDKTVINNRPDIVLKDKASKIVTIIDVSHPLDHNLQKAFGEKLRKYEELAEEIRDMWRMEKVRTLPIIISCNGLVSNAQITELRKYEIPIHVFRAMQRNVVLETCRIVRKVLNISV